MSGEMKKNGRVVLLTAHPQTVLDRVKDSDDRPLLNGHKCGMYRGADGSKKRYTRGGCRILRCEITDNKTGAARSVEICIQKLLEMDENHV